MTQPIVLITNDDGVQAPGIKALAAAMAGVTDVYVVAPDREVSACAQSLTLKNPLRVEPLGDRVWSVDGTPADCVNLALVKLLPRRPDAVFSGINRGANLGEDVFYSGTVGGAREGSFFGVPSVAMSLAMGSSADYTHAAAFAARTSRIPIAVSALLVNLYEPVRLAEDMAVLDHLSAGRVSYTLGLGYRREEYELHGRTWETRGADIEARIVAIKQAWAGGQVTPAPYSPGGPFLMYGGGTPAATPPWAPQPGDAALNRGEVFLDGAEVILLESFPMQARLRLVGSRPTPCHALRVVVSPPDADNAIAVEVYTVVDPSQICTQVLEPFEETIPLGSFPTAEHPSGTYTVLVNGELAGEFAA